MDLDVEDTERIALEGIDSHDQHVRAVDPHPLEGMIDRLGQDSKNSPHRQQDIEPDLPWLSAKPQNMVYIARAEATNRLAHRRFP